MLNDRPNFSQNDKNFCPRYWAQEQGKEDFRRRISTYLLYSWQKAEEVLGVRSVFLPSVVGLKGSKSQSFQDFSGFRSGLPEVFGRRLLGVLLPKNEYKKDTLQNTECLIVFNLFPYSYKAVVREQKFLYFRSKLGLSYNNIFKLV